MKKNIVFLLCLVLSVVCLTGCTHNDEVFTEKSHTADAEQITEIRIDVRDRQIEVTPSSDNQIRIDYFENDKAYYDIAVSNDHVLTMTAVNNKDWADYIGGKSVAGFRKIVLQLPDTLMTTLKLTTTNEDIALPALTIAGDLSLSTHGGNIVFDKLKVGNAISLGAKNGNILGTIIGSYDDYAISCAIKKGESNLPSHKESGTKTLMVSNNNGDIAIEFVKE